MPARFNLGLVMAGAVSAGAYTGGAIDFLLQALEAWYKAKGRGDPNAPPHEVTLKIATGASAGGMTAAMLATVLREEVPPITAAATDADRRGNKFYDAWVRKVSIDKLLGSGDLDGNDKPVQSLLDSTVLQGIADAVITPGIPGPPRPYVADPFLVAVTLTNLRGVPYSVDFQGLAGKRMPYTMRLHADQMSFSVGLPIVELELEALGFTPPSKAMPLDPTRVGEGHWKTLADAALATGAFPFGLAPRTLSQSASNYNDRLWYHPYARDQHGSKQYGFYAPLDAAMGVPAAFRYEFTCVDGGTIDNEPMGLAREFLGWNNGEAFQSPSAIVLVDPFPNQEKFETEYDFPVQFNLFKMVPTLLGALINQARFKPEELTRAIDPTIFNQFMLAPVRRVDGQPMPEDGRPLACGGLGGFAGFLSEDFRAHDFQLGRVNAQSFLLRHFVLPEDDPLFAEWTSDMRNEHRIRRDRFNRVIDDAHDTVKDETGNRVAAVPPISSFLPIIPLTGEAVRERERAPVWPKYGLDQLIDLREMAEKRAKIVVERLIEKMDGAVTKFLLRRVWWLKRGEWLNQIEERIRADLRAGGLMQ